MSDPEKKISSFFNDEVFRKNDKYDIASTNVPS